MLQVDNVTRQVALVTQGRIADTFFTRLKGLVGVRRLPAGDGLLITPCREIHCMFMSIPIDVLYVDKQDRVVALDPNMQPWRVGRVVKAAHAVIELPAGTLAATGTAVGDQLRVQRG
jgi:uncharacterized protein